MSDVLLPLTLLVAAYIGSMLADGRTIGGLGLPSGAEWLVIGVALGPQALGVFQGSTLDDFEPLVIGGLGWTALVVGVDYGYVGEKRISGRGMGLGLVLSTLCGGGIAGATFWYCSLYLGASEFEAATTALAMALVGSETTRHAVRWVAERHGASGPLSTTVAELADADDALPLLGMAVLVTLTTTPRFDPSLDLAFRLGTTFGLGVILGLIAAGLLARSLAFGESWAVMIGVGLLGIGASMRLGLASLSVMFIAGVVLSLFSRRHAELRRLLAPTERPVTLPILLLGGASLDWRDLPPEVLGLLGVVVGARVVIKFASGWLIAWWVPEARKSPNSTGTALLASGTLAMSIGLYGYLSLDSQLGEWLLLVASVTTVLGELAGPAALRRALMRAGEVSEVARSGDAA